MKDVENTETKLKEECKETYNSPRWTGEILDCSLPLTLDTYSNCSFGCIYCFSQYQRAIGNGKANYLSKKVTSIKPERVRRILSGEDKNSQFYEYVKNKRPIQYGGLSDQFDGYERKYGKTYETLKYLRELKYPICFSTKSAWVFFDEKYRELFRGMDNWNMKFSIITLDEETARRIEVGVPSPRERLAAMHEYTTLNKGGATLRLRPFILGVSDKTYIDLIKEAHKAGATAVTTEFFCLEMRSVKTAKEHYKEISDVCGFDIVEFYRKHSATSGYLRLNRKIKEPYIKKMQALCKELGMRFYVSDACFKECSDNTCCCGLPPEWEYSRGHFAAALQIAKKTGSVRFRDIEKDLQWANFDAVKGECNLARQSSEARAKYSGLTMKEYIRYIWNNPKRGQSPYKIFAGVLVPDGLDEDSNVIYRYNPKVTFEPVQNTGYELNRL